MKSYLLVICVLLSVAYNINAQQHQQHQQHPQSTPGYTTRFDNINLDQILSSKRLITSYVQCLLGSKTCSPEASELKRVLPDAIKTKCARCNPKQKLGALKVLQTLQKDYPSEWKLLTAKWDPTGENFRLLQAELTNQQ